MTSEHWQKIEEIYHAALDREPNKRSAYLLEACSGDDELRREVESLLAQETQVQDFLESPAIEVAAKALAENQRRSLIDRQFGPYRIVSLLGVGGMGEVYQAHDTNLGRDVAIKVLPAVFTNDPERLSRFQREARTLAALNHPNIATIYGFDYSDGVHYLVMELVPGETLAEQISKGRLPLKETLRVAGQIAEGLEAAHEKSVIHRDLKPANVKVTPDGRVKVLDFGLAKAFAGEGVIDISQGITLGEEGRILGTPAYMSPEQARGEVLDERTDLFSFGVVLYEMATGKLPFRGNTLAEVFGAILYKVPASPSRVNPDLPPKLEDIINKALEKDHRLRCQSATELRADLARLNRDTDLARAVARSDLDGAVSSPSATVTSRTRHTNTLIWITAVTAVVIFAAMYLFRSKSNPPTTANGEWLPLTNFADSAVSPALSPDGRMLTFIRGADTFFGPGQIYIKLLPDGEPVQLTHDQRIKMSPQFSPDGSRIAFTTPWDTWVVPALGGESRVMLPNASGLTWIDNLHVLFSQMKGAGHMGVVTSSESRAEIHDLYLPPRERGMAHRSSLSPDHKWLLLAEMDNGGWLPCRLVPFEGTSLGKTVGPLAAGCTHADWSPDGTQMYFSSDAGGRFHIWRQRFPDGQPERLTSGPTEEEGIAVAPDGRSVITSVGLAERTIWVHDAKGDRQISSEGYGENPRFSYDGRRLYYLVRPRGGSAKFVEGELWVADLDSNRSERLLPGFSVTGYDISPDGKNLAFSATDKQGRSHLWLASVDLGSSPRQLVSSVSQDQPHFDHAGHLYFRAAEGNFNFLYRARQDGGEPVKVLPDPIFEYDAVSPDGQWAIVASVGMSGTYAYPIAGGSPLKICAGYCPAAWAPGGQFFYMQLPGGWGDEGQTLLLPIPPSKSLPAIPRAGIQAGLFRGPGLMPDSGSKENLRSIRGSRVLNGTISPGPSLDLYAWSRRSVHRNLYRVPLP